MLTQDTPRQQHPSSMGGTARALAYQYDRDGNRTRIAHPDGVYFDLAYDGLDRPSLMAAPGASIAYTSYTPAGLPDGASRGNGELSIYAWDGVQRLNTLTHIFPVAPAAANVQWQLARNAAGQIAATTRINDAYAWGGAYTVNRAYTANGLNQYTLAGSANFSYDLNGNLVGDGANSFTYDPENRLVAASGAHAATLSYDPLGRLWQVTSGSSTTRFLYDGDALVAEYDAAGAMQRRHVHWVGADVPVVSYAGSGLAQPSYLHADQQGSIVALSDASGTVTAIDSYDEYGIPGAGNTGRFQFTGQAWIAELGLYYYKVRFYSPTLGRFLQIDPVGYADQYNLYEYVGDDPVDRTDPTGTTCTENNGRYTCQIDNIVLAPGQHLTRREAAEIRQFNERYTSAVNRLAAHDRTVTVEATGGRSRTSFRISSREVARALVARQFTFLPQGHSGNALMSTGGNPHWGLQSVRTTIYQSGIGSAEWQIVHEGIHRTASANDNNWSDDMGGYEPFRSEHQSPYNNAAHRLLGERP